MVIWGILFIQTHSILSLQQGLPPAARYWWQLRRVHRRSDQDRGAACSSSWWRVATRWVALAGSGSGATAPHVQTPPPLLLTYMLRRPPVAKVPKSGFKTVNFQSDAAVGSGWARHGLVSDIWAWWTGWSELSARVKMGGMGMGMACSLRKPATWHAVVAVFLQVVISNWWI